MPANNFPNLAESMSEEMRARLEEQLRTEAKRLGIPMCHHPKRFSEDCIDFNMHEEKEIETEQSGSSEIPNYLNELADYARRQVEELLPVIKKYNDYSEEQIEELRTHLMAMFLEGAGWQKEQMMKEAVEGKIIFLLNGDVAVNIGDTDKYNLGQKIRVIVLPKED